MSESANPGLPDWPVSQGQPGAMGQLRSTPEDFRVDELPAIEPSGEGEHWWLRVQKTGANTDWVAGQLARAAGCSPRDVGYAGMKDRHAVTTQWFSLPVSPGVEQEPAAWVIPDVRILETSRHQKKLKRGVLRGNRFRLIVRNLQGDLSQTEDRLGLVRCRGVPNYFGPQRFGFGGQNVRRGVQWLESGGRIARSKRSIYLSAVRSFLFNQVLAERVRRDNWGKLIAGDIAMLDGTHSVFPCAEIDDELHRRCTSFDLHPTGPLPGQGVMLPTAESAIIEFAALEPYSDYITGLRSARVEADRRSLRLVPRNFEWELATDRLELSFDLPAGAYATTVISEIIDVMS